MFGDRNMYRYHEQRRLGQCEFRLCLYLYPLPFLQDLPGQGVRSQYECDSDRIRDEYLSSTTDTYRLSLDHYQYGNMEQEQGNGEGYCDTKYPVIGEDRDCYHRRHSLHCHPGRSTMQCNSIESYY